MRRRERHFRGRGAESLEYRRELRRVQRRRTDKMLLGLLLAGTIGLYAAVELGRAMYAMQTVKSFASSINQRPPAEVKQDLSRFANQLADHNPLVRNAAMTALKLGTGWNLGNNSLAWRQWWREHEPYWQYRRSTETNHSPPAVDWRSNLPPLSPSVPVTP